MQGTGRWPQGRGSNKTKEGNHALSGDGVTEKDLNRYSVKLVNYLYDGAESTQGKIKSRSHILSNGAVAYNVCIMTHIDP
jgi:hypothetical protein